MQGDWFSHLHLCCRDLCVELDNEKCVMAAKEKLDVLEELEKLDRAKVTAPSSGKTAHWVRVVCGEMSEINGLTMIMLR